MIRSLLKKVTFLCLVIITLLLFFRFEHPSDVIAADYDLIEQWKGLDMTHEVLREVSIDSPYVPFSSIYQQPHLIDVEKKVVIENAMDLYHFSVASMGEHKTLFLSLDYVLGNHIDYYDAVLTSVAYRFHPIGFAEPFTGTFDGQGFEISNLYFQTILDQNTYDQLYFGMRYFSMFSVISSSAEIKNFGLINPIMIQPIDWGLMAHVAPLVGENNGLIQNVYYVDTRRETSGLHIEGDMHLSGLVSVNKGHISNAYVATPHVKALSVFNILSTSVFLRENTGTLDQVYYDQSIYVDRNASTSFAIGLTKDDFQNASYFSSDWYFNHSYHGLTTDLNFLGQLTLYHHYPILRGLAYQDGILFIKDALDLLYMNELFLVSGYFRSAHYQIIHDIDMNQVSIDAYVAAPVAFSGQLSSSLISEETILYERTSLSGGTKDYHSIIDLRIRKGTALGNFASYGLFALLFGQVRHLNFVGLSIDTTDIINHAHRTKILVGAIAGQMNQGLIDDVHLNLHVNIRSSITPISKLLVGGLVGEGTGNLTNISAVGAIHQNIQSFRLDSNHSATAGILGYSEGISLSYIKSDVDVLGVGYASYQNQTTYVAGILGHGKIITAEKLMNLGDIVSHNLGSHLGMSYVGGIFGLIVDQKNMISGLFNQGDLTLNLSSKLSSNFSGVMNVDGSGYSEDSIASFTNLSNQGILKIDLLENIYLSEADLSDITIHGSGVMVAENLNATYQGLFNESHSALNLSLIDSFAANLNQRGESSGRLTQSYNTGNFNFTSSHLVTQPHLKISGNALGNHLDYRHLRNDGNIEVIFNHGSGLTQGNLYVLGLLETLNQDKTAFDLYNGGHLSIFKQTEASVLMNIFMSGILYKNANSNHLISQNYVHSSVNFLTEYTSPLDHILNHGYLTLSGNFTGSSKLSGVAIYNESLLTNAYNTGHIKNYHQTPLDNEAAGLIYAQLGQYAFLRDASNAGTVEALNLGSGFSHASGIVLRNDRLENGNLIQTGSNHRFQKIMFAINYGEIYAWSNHQESLTISQETRSKASGILTLGLSSIISVMNYGDVYSKYLSSGIIGFIPLNRFGALVQSNEIYLGNIINYGRIRAISSYSSTYELELNSNPTRTLLNAFGAIFGKFHTGTESWTFLNQSTSSNKFPIDLINFRNIINFDPKNDILGNAPTVSLSNDMIQYGLGNQTLLDIINEMKTIKPVDQSKEPFNHFPLSYNSKTTLYGKVVSAYTMSENPGGMFYLPLVNKTTGSEQYLSKYLIYTRRIDIGETLLAKLDQNLGEPYIGIYAMTDSKSIHHGHYLPDALDLNRLSPKTSSQPSTIWQGSEQDIGSPLYFLKNKMKQVSPASASYLYDLEIVQTNSEGEPIEQGLTLSKPEINEARKLITYYLPTNASILSHQSVSTQHVVGYYETSFGVGKGRKVPYINEAGTWTYKIVGAYKKSGSSYDAIGPYHTDGIYNVTFQYTSNPKSVKDTDDLVGSAIYAQTDLSGAQSHLSMLYIHRPHVKNFISGNAWWVNEPGYQVLSQTLVQPGYGPYKATTFPFPPNYGPIYTYAGPSQELMTYDRVEQQVKIYAGNDLYFGISNRENAYNISEGATLVENDLTKVPKSLGTYDLISNPTTGEKIDAISDYYGSIRVKASNYHEDDPNTYQDYNIRIVRTEDAGLSNLLSLHVNGQHALPSFSNFRDVTANTPISYRLYQQEGILNVTYQTLNLPHQYDLKPQVKVYYDEPGHEDELLDPNFYQLENGIVSNTNINYHFSGVLGSGTVNLLFKVDDLLPSGAYRIEILMITGEVAIIRFEKMKSPEAQIKSYTFDGKTFIPNTQSEVHMIDYGIYYDPDDLRTSHVNFSNLSLLENISFDEMDQNLPSYLSGLEISNFATLKDIELMIETYAVNRYQYKILYRIEAENGTESIFTHILREHPYVVIPESIYMNGSLIEYTSEPTIIAYTEAPTVRIEFDLKHVFVKNQQTISMTSLMIPAGHDQAILHQDYFINLLAGVGFEVDFNRFIPLGVYQFNARYEQEVFIWGEQLSWTFDFEPVIFEKVQNNNSLISDIQFISDTIYSGFNTIVHYQALTENTYTFLYENPELRSITVLPTKGIYYGNYAEEPAFWIVGQVQKTNLTFYQPTFTLPHGGTIRRVIDYLNIGPEYQSDVLNADFSPIGDTFNFILYRVYAHDYDPDINPLNYTNYYIAVQDISNNIRFNLTISNQSSQSIDALFVKVRVCDLIFGCSSLPVLEMGVHATYDVLTDTFKNHAFQTTMSGMYQVLPSIGKDLSYYVIVQSQVISGNSFVLENALLPKKYFITVVIVDRNETRPWGEWVTTEIPVLPE